MERPSFHLSEFEGPLDLLLHLIAKHKLNILDIEISELLRQYLLFIENREDQDLEVGAEFLEMAARLVHIKTLMLLPKHEEEADDLRTQLSGELMEYRICQMAAQDLARRAEEHRVYVRAPMDVGEDPTYRLTHPASVLLTACASASGRAQRKAPPERKAFSGIVERRVVSVGSRIIHLLRRMRGGGTMAFDDVFSDQTDRSELVATFLALLELMKAGRVTVSDDGSEVTFSRLGARKKEEVRT
jgi:segregation and condensation protein A